MRGIFGKLLFEILFEQAQKLKDLEELTEEEAVSDCRDYIAEIVRDVLNAPVNIEIRLEPDAKMPTQPYPTDACWDLYVQWFTLVSPNTTTLVPSGVYINIPEGYEGTLMLRSGLGKKGLSVHPAVFDAGYQGELVAFVHNRTNEPFLFYTEDRVVQFCLRRKIPICWKRVDELTTSDRGSKGHGSSGR